jgi:tetratricopeptide (TPR) repeat protein
MLAAQSNAVVPKKQLSAGAKLLLENLNGVASGFRSVAIAVVADAGMGKTYTVQQTIGALPCTRVTIHAAEPLHWLHLKLPAAPKKLPIWAQQIFRQIKDQQVVSEKSLTQALHSYLMALTPIVVHLEDAHEASVQQLSLWVEVAEMLRKSKGVALIATSRLPLPAVFHEFALQSLDFIATQEVLQDVTDFPLPLEAVQWIYQHSLGNPLYTLEFFEHALRQGFLWQHHKQWSWRRPDSSDTLPKDLEATIVDRLEKIAEQASQPQVLKQVLLTLALLPDVPALKDIVFSEWLPAEQDVFNLELLGTGLWSANQFVHPLYPEVLRSQLWSQQRVLVARALLPVTLEIAPEFVHRLIPAAQLAPEATLGVWKQVAEASQEKQPVVAGRALAAAAAFKGEHQAEYATKASQLLRQIDLSEALRLSALAREIKPNDFEVALQYATMLSDDGQFEKVEDVLAAFSEKQLSDVPCLQLRLNMFSRFGQYQKIIHIWDVLRANPQPAHIALHKEIATALIALDRYTEAQDLIQDTLLESISFDYKILLQNTLGISLRRTGKLPEALQILNEVYLKLQQHDPQQTMLAEREMVLKNRALVLGQLGQLDLAILDAEQGVQILQIMGDTYRLALAQSNLAGFLIPLALFEAAEKLLLEAYEILMRLPTSRFLLNTLETLCLLYLEWVPPMGSTMALKYAREALICARKVASSYELAQSLLNIARVEAQFGDAQKAWLLIEEQQSLAATLDNKVYMVFGAWVRLLCLEASGQQAVAMSEFPAFLDSTRPEEESATFERLALEFDRMTNNQSAAQQRVSRLQSMGQTAQSALFIAKRYFPEIFMTQNQTVALDTTDSRLEVLGEIRFSGQIISKRLRKTREFLALLLEARLTGRSAVTPLEIIDALYPNDNEDKASSSVRQLIYRIRKNFGENVVQYSANSYFLGVSSDAEQFLQTLDTTLWHGVYLAQETMKLSPNVSEALYHALLRATQALLLTNPIEAARVSRILLAANPYNIESFRLCIKALAAVQAHDLALVYKTNRKSFLSIGEVLPELWQEWLRFEA